MPIANEQDMNDDEPAPADVQGGIEPTQRLTQVRTLLPYSQFETRLFWAIADLNRFENLGCSIECPSACICLLLATLGRVFYHDPARCTACTNIRYPCSWWQELGRGYDPPLPLWAISLLFDEGTAVAVLAPAPCQNIARFEQCKDMLAPDCNF